MPDVLFRRTAVHPPRPLHHVLTIMGPETENEPYLLSRLPRSRQRQHTSPMPGRSVSGSSSGGKTLDLPFETIPAAASPLFLPSGPERRPGGVIRNYSFKRTSYRFRACVPSNQKTVKPGKHHGIRKRSRRTNRQPASTLQA